MTSTKTNHAFVSMEVRLDKYPGSLYMAGQKFFFDFCLTSTDKKILGSIKNICKSMTGQYEKKTK